jgi:Ni/Co efflux regulator RcnB
MKRLLLCAVAAFALAVPAGAGAQRQNDRHDSNRQHQQNQQQQNRSTRTTHQRSESRQSRPNHTTRVTRTTSRTTRVTRPAVQQTRRVTTNVYRIGHRPTSFHRVHVSAFRYPRGYSYRRWGIGSILPRLFLSSLYYWNDYGALGLGAPPPGYVWVRYGPDLLLVNRYNGRIADVIYGAFY